jgi:non-heme chloroperoxidase
VPTSGCRRRLPFVPIADSAMLAVKLLKKGTLKVYEKFPHGMCTTHADVINPDILDFIKR